MIDPASVPDAPIDVPLVQPEPVHTRYFHACAYMPDLKVRNPFAAPSPLARSLGPLLSSKTVPGEDQYVNQHTNRLCIVGVSPRHPMCGKVATKVSARTPRMRARVLGGLTLLSFFGPPSPGRVSAAVLRLAGQEQKGRAVLLGHDAPLPRYVRRRVRIHALLVRRISFGGNPALRSRARALVAACAANCLSSTPACWWSLPC